MKKYNYDRFKTSDYDLATFNGPEAGEQYIDISVYNLDGSKVQLSSFLNKPIVLETGSKTCPMYAKCVNPMNEFAEQYTNLNFLLLYIREAHPGNKTKGIRSLDEKMSNAKDTCKLYGEKRTIIVDELDGEAHKVYGELPNMVYVIDTDETILFRGDWNNIEKLKEVLQTVGTGKVFTQDHFAPTKPNPKIIYKAFGEAGFFVAFWDFITGLPELMRQHRKADKKANL